MLEAVSILYHYLSARRLNRITSTEQLHRHRQRRMAHFRSKVLPRFSFYRHRLTVPWRDLPIMDKPAVIENFARLNRLGISHEEALARAQEELRASGTSATIDGVTIGVSSGTSGQRGVYLVNKSERLKWLGTILAKALPGSIIERQRVALCLSANSSLYTTTQHSRRLTFGFFDLSLPEGELLGGIDSFSPTILIAPAQALRFLALRQAAGEISLRPAKVFSCAEVLDPEDARLVSETWSQPVHQIYQCTEGFLGITCQYGSIHLNEEYVLFERDWLDRDSRRFNPVITDFSRRTQAMVRYRMNDILVERKNACPCGSPLTAIDRIEGRTDDIVRLQKEDGCDGWVPIFPDAIRASILDADPRIRDFRLVQTASGDLAVALDCDTCDAAMTRVQNALRLTARRAGAAEPLIVAQHWPDEPGHANKLRRVRSMLA